MVYNCGGGGGALYIYSLKNTIRLNIILELAVISIRPQGLSKKAIKILFRFGTPHFSEKIQQRNRSFASGLLRQCTCPTFFALGATTLASMPHQVQAPFFWRKGGCVMCLFKRGGEKWMWMECEGFKLYEVAWGVYCSSFESLKTKRSPEKGPLEFRKVVLSTTIFQGITDHTDRWPRGRWERWLYQLPGVGRCCRFTGGSGKSWGDAEEHNVQPISKYIMYIYCLSYMCVILWNYILYVYFWGYHILSLLYAYYEYMDQQIYVWMSIPSIERSPPIWVPWIR